MEDRYFTWSDSWVIAGILWSIPGEAEINLSAIIGAGDMLNHAIYSQEELKTGFHKAQKKGLISIKQGRIIVADKAKEVRKRVQAMPGGLFTIVDRLEKRLNSRRTNLMDVDDKAVDPCDFINGVTFNESYEKYRAVLGKSDNHRLHPIAEKAGSG